MQKTRILYVEDELSLGKIVSETLSRQGYDVHWEKDGARVLSFFENNTPDICILDIMLPNTDGYSLCKTIHGLFPALPIVFLTAKTDTSDVVAGFESGATDYIRKPFSIEELIARIENQISLRKGGLIRGTINENFQIGRYILDIARYEIRSPSGCKKVSNREMQLLRILYANRNSLTPRKDLLMSVWGDDSYFNSRNLDVYIKKLRNYFSADASIQIITLKSTGYLFLVP